MSENSIGQTPPFEMTYCPSISKVQGTITLTKYHELITTGFVRPQIEAIRQAAAQGDKERCATLKRSLPAVIVGAVFEEQRKKEGFRRGLCQLVLDVDKLDAPQLADLTTYLRKDPIVHYFNISPSGNGVKIFISYTTESGEVPTDWATYEALHHTAYDYVVDAFRQCYGYDIDTTGRDPMRICFLSYDPEAYYNPQPNVVVVAFDAATCSSRGEAKGEESEPAATAKPPTYLFEGKSKENLESLLTLTRASEDRLDALFVIICKNLYSAGDRFKDGSRNDFVYKAACELNKYGIPRDKALVLIPRSMHKIIEIETDASFEKKVVTPLPTPEVESTVKSAYDNNRAEHATAKLFAPLMKHIYLQVEIQRAVWLRKNLLSLRIEYYRRTDRKLTGKEHYKEFDDNLENHFSLRLKEMGHLVNPKQVHELVNSPFTPAFDPVETYLESLPAWDGSDHIGRFADSVCTNDPDRFRRLLTMWYVGMIKSYRDDDITNHIVIVLYSAGGGIGKTFFIDRILPPELQQAVHQGMVQAEKDSIEKLSTCLVISIDELNHFKRDEMQELKELITRKIVDFRINYDRFGHLHPHRASFIATCNSTNFMSDPSGNRRFHVFEVTSVDMDYQVDYGQLFAQVIHLHDTGFKYYFTPQEQEELSAYNYQFENNDAEYDFLVEYVRKYPGNCKQRKKHTATEILQRMKFFFPETVIDKAAQIRMGKALARRNFQYIKDRNKKLYECYLLTAEQAEYCVQYKSTTTYLDVLFDKFVPKEILLAGDSAKIADIYKARECLDQTNGKKEEAQILYNKYIKEKSDINFTNEGSLPF